MEQIEFLILKNLIHNEKYLRKSIPFIKSEYFEDPHQKMVYEEIFSFVEKYNELPTKEVLTIEVEKRSDINEDSFKKVAHLIHTVTPFKDRKIRMSISFVCKYGTD